MQMSLLTGFRQIHYFATLFDFNIGKFWQKLRNKKVFWKLLFGFEQIFLGNFYIFLLDIFKIYFLFCFHINDYLFLNHFWLVEKISLWFSVFDYFIKLYLIIIFEISK